VTLALVIFLPRLFTNLKKFNLKNADIGWNRLPKWSDILLAPSSLIIYFILSALAIFVISKIFPGFDINQAQDVGFDNLNTRFDYILAFISLVVIAPLAEETLFRGYLYGKLKQHFPVWLAIVVVSLTFGALHGSWNVAIDTFVLSVVLCVLREMSDSLWAPALLHMAKNGLAFYFLFINPILLSRIGG
jgi:membrane protease YdiL (CAAX protease family)